MNFNDPKFLALKATWYNKLRKSGFTDAEDHMERLLEYHNFKYSLKDPLAFASQTRYYQLAGQLLHSHTFKSAEEKQIWGMHAQGKSITATAKRMGLSKYAVEKVVKELAELIKV